MTEPY
jgi:hypothetical protein